MDEDVHRYRGVEIDVSYDANRCTHVRECVEGLSAVFDPDRRPWIDADGADPDEIATIVERCPTGALHYERRDDGEDERTPARNAVTVAADGPLYLRGDIELRTPDGDALLEDTRVALCRCGRSENRPLCDGSHERAFAADGLDPDAAIADDENAAIEGDAGDAETAEPDGDRLIATLTENGPVRLSGPFELGGAEGETDRDEAFLCRCGASGTKPFCDGSHDDVGFTTNDGE